MTFLVPIYYRNARRSLREARVARREGDAASWRGDVGQAFARWQAAGRCVQRARVWRERARIERKVGAS